MDSREFEKILRKVVREELAAILSGAGAEVPPPQEVRRADAAAVREHPFDLSDRELEQAEYLLPEAERPVLRQRVMAYRLEKQGNRSGAQRMRKRAEALAKRLAG
jgi:hypothetical protein